MTATDARARGKDELLELMREIEAVASELLALGGERLRSRWPGLDAIRRLAAQAAADPGLLDDPANRTEVAERVVGMGTAMYGGYGSFADYGIEGPSETRFEELKDELAGLIGRL